MADDSRLDSCSDPDCSICGGGQAQYHAMAQAAGLEDKPATTRARRPLRRRVANFAEYGLPVLARTVFYALLATDAAVWLARHV